MPFGATGSSGSFLEEQWREFAEAAPPCMPFVGGAGGFVKSGFDARRFECVAVALHAVIEAFALGGADAQEKHADLLVERLCVGHDAAVVGLRIEGSAAKAAT